MPRKRRRHSDEYEDDLLLVRIAREMSMAALKRNPNQSRLSAAVDFLGDAETSLKALMEDAKDIEDSRDAAKLQDETRDTGGAQ